MEEKDIQRALQREYIPYYAMEEIKKRISDIEKDGYSYVDTTTENIVLRDYLVPNSLEPGYYTDKDFARLKDGEAIKVMKSKRPPMAFRPRSESGRSVLTTIRLAKASSVLGLPADAYRSSA